MPQPNAESIESGREAAQPGARPLGVHLFGQELPEAANADARRIEAPGPSGRAMVGRAKARPPRFPSRIETRRLCLRAPVVEDFDPLRAMASDPSMFRYSERTAMTPEESWALLLRHIGHWSATGYGVFTVLERETGEVIGQVGASAFCRGLGRDFDPFPEMTWTIRAPFRGRGYATEAAAAFLDVLDHQAHRRRSVCLIHIDNQASLRVAAKLGFRFFRFYHYRNYQAGLFCR